MTMKFNLKKNLLAAAIMGSLTGCGGADLTEEQIGEAVRQLSGSGVSVGTVTSQRANSVTVNGVQFDLQAANISVNGDSGSQTDLELGQVVSIKADYFTDGTATATVLEYHGSLEGPIDNIDAETASLIVMGQRIIIKNDTQFDDTDLNTLIVGQIVEVSGVVNTKGQIEASYIGLCDQDTLEFGVVGSVSALDTTAQTFKINDLTIGYSQASDLDLVEDLLADNTFVNLYGTLSTDSNGQRILQAIEIELDEAMETEDGNLVEISGFVSTTLENGVFSLSGLTIKVTDDTSFDYGDSSLLGLDTHVEVEGVVNSDGTITAKYIYAEPENEIDIMAIIEAIDLENNTFTALGKTFSINANTLIADQGDYEDYDEWESSLSLSDLKVGDLIEISAYPSSNEQILTATYIERLEVDMLGEVFVGAVIESVDLTNKTITVLGRTIDLTQTDLSIFSFIEEEWDDEWESDMHETEDMDVDEEANEEELDEEEDFYDASELTVDEFLNKISEGDFIFLTGTSNGSTITWQTIDLECGVEDDEDD